MRTTSIGIWSNNIEIVHFNLTGPDPSNPYTIKAITGLDIEEITSQYYASGSVSGTPYNDLMLSPREITMRIALKPNYRTGRHPADLRGTLLKAVASNRTGLIQLRFNDSGVCWGAISGSITKFESPVTTRDTEVQFTMKCEDPVIRSLTVTSQIVSELDNDEPVLIDPISTWPHGFKFKLTFTGSVNPFSIEDPNGEWKFQIDYAFLSGDELYFSSEYGDKYLYRIRSAVTLNLMDTLDSASIWPMIFPGENVFEIVGNTFDWDEVYFYETHAGL